MNRVIFLLLPLFIFLPWQAQCQTDIKIVIDDATGKLKIDDTIFGKTISTTDFKVTIVKPDPHIDCKLLIIKPDPSVNYKILIVDLKKQTEIVIPEEVKRKIRRLLDQYKRQ